MTAVIFVGPTLSLAEARAILDADYRPPAAEGDVYRAARNRPQIIGIIDGYFDRVPAVWHKEILWAMSQGIHVYGSASMGALRAAELDVFGMEGVGAVFEAYRDGRIEDDDEVAVVHEPAEFGYRAGSEAMVDIRHTLVLAAESAVLSDEVAAALAAIAKALFYPDRSWRRVLRAAADKGLPQGELEALNRWLGDGRTSVKKADALAMLAVIRDRLMAGVKPKQVRYSFENSAMWEVAWRLAGESDGADPVLLSSVLDELRLEGEPYLRAQQAALLRVLAIKHARVQGYSDIHVSADAFWRDRHAADADARAAWMHANRVDEVQLQALIADQSRVDWIKSLAQFEATGYLLDQLRVSGDYPRLVERALAKQVALLEGEPVAMASDELLRWYFEGRLGRAVPADIGAYCRELGFENPDDLLRALAREHSFVAGHRVAAGSAS